MNEQNDSSDQGNPILIGSPHSLEEIRVAKTILEHHGWLFLQGSGGFLALSPSGIEADKSFPLAPHASWHEGPMVFRYEAEAVDYVMCSIEMQASIIRKPYLRDQGDTKSPKPSLQRLLQRDTKRALPTSQGHMTNKQVEELISMAASASLGELRVDGPLEGYEHDWELSIVTGEGEGLAVIAYTWYEDIVDGAMGVERIRKDLPAFELICSAVNNIEALCRDLLEERQKSQRRRTKQA